MDCLISAWITELQFPMSESPNEQKGMPRWMAFLSLLAILIIPVYFFVANYLTVKEGANVVKDEYPADSLQVGTQPISDSVRVE